MKNSLRS